MSEDKGSVNHTEDGSAESEKKDSVAYATYSKLLGEKKKKDSEIAEMRAKLDAIEQEKMESQGKFKEQNELLKKQLVDSNNKLKNMFQEFGAKTLKGKFEAEAKNAGCVDSDALYKLVDLSGVEINDDFSFDADQLKSVISEAQKSRGYLFKKEVSKVNDAAPNSNKQHTGAIDVKSLKGDELKKLLALKLS